MFDFQNTLRYKEKGKYFQKLFGRYLQSKQFNPSQNIFKY